MPRIPVAPVARVDVVTETRFGVDLPDPYRWMETEDAELAAWLAGQGAHASAVLAALPDRDALLARITELTEPASEADGDTRFQLAGGRLFFRRQLPGGAAPALMAADEAGRRVLLDPASHPGLAGLPGTGHWNLDWYAPSPDGELVACGLSRGGSEASTLRILRTADGALRGDAVTGTFHGVVSWLDNGSLLCHQYPEPAPGTPPDQRRRDSRTVAHQVGGDDRVILARGVSPRVPLTSLDRPFVLTAGDDWLLAVISHSALGVFGEEMSACTVYVGPRAEALSDPAGCPWQRVAGPDDGVRSWTAHGDTLYLVVDGGRRRAAVVSVPLASPDLSAAAVVVPEDSDRSVLSVRVTGDQLLVHDRLVGLSRLRRVPLAGGEPREVPLPAAGLLSGLSTDPGAPGAYFQLESWTLAPRAYRYDPAAAQITDTGWLPPGGPDFSGIVTRDLRVPARDGTLIPLRVVHRAGLELDGSAPAIVNGYGSYGIIPGHLYEPWMLAWYERGGVYAQAGLRGGGEHGREWHEAGRGTRKENTITDFIDCAEYLVARGYTSPGRVAGRGGSAGGIPTGGALVRRPGLWGAMIMLVPLTNAVRGEFSENGPINIGEDGSVTTEDGLRSALISDSYLRVRDGTRYPAVLLTTGLNDPRVDPWQPGKLAARLQAATASGRPVLLRVDPDAGHGQGSTPAQRRAEEADVLAFLLHELGGSKG
jgi:prolyl oligopeptidase